MIFKASHGRLEPFPSNWEIGELELENHLFSSGGARQILNADIFREELLFLQKQVSTKQGKRADIVALDKYGNGVFIELKKGAARHGVETQALQYLANFANLRGERFLARFKESKSAVGNYLGDYAVVELNLKSRIILVAQSFDETVFSMGEWLALQGVAFRCIEYVPFKIKNETFLSFSVCFDRSRESLYQLGWESRSPECFWHNIGDSPLANGRNDKQAQDAWWAEHLKEGMVTASFTNEPGDAGDKVLNSYVTDDRIFAYTSGYGLIGWGIVKTPIYQLVEIGRDKFAASGRHRHRLTGIKWQTAALSVGEAIHPKELKEQYALSHPIQTKSRIRRDHADTLIATMKARFAGPLKP